MGEALATGRVTHGHVQALTQVALPAEVDLSIDADLDFPTAARRIAEAARDNQEELLRAADILTAALDRPSLKLDLGYSRRSASPSLRRALIARDRTCTAPGCDRPHWMCEIRVVNP